MATFDLHLSSPEATAALAERFAPHLVPGDFIGLIGGLGAGKSLFARALIARRLAAAGRSEDIPSPSYTLIQFYDVGDAEIWHADLYRLGDPGELVELGLDDMTEAISIVEWADRLGAARPARALEVALAPDPARESARHARIRASGIGWDWLPAVVAEAAA